MTVTRFLGFPPDITSDELRDRIKLAVENQMQIYDYIKRATDELVRREKEKNA